MVMPEGNFGGVFKTKEGRRPGRKIVGRKKAKKKLGNASRIATFYMVEDGDDAIITALRQYVADSEENASAIVRKLLRRFLKRNDYL